MERGHITWLVRRAPLIAALLAILPGAAAAGWEQLPRAFLPLRITDPRALASFADRIEAAGGHVSVIDASGTAVVYGDDAVLARPEIARDVAARFRSDVPARALATLDPARRQAAAAWNFALTLDALDASPGDEPPAGRDGPAFPDAGPRPVALAARPGPAPFDASTHVPYGADYYDTSEFLAGRIAVGVWLFDNVAPGSNWTASELSQTLGGVQAGLDNWVRKGSAPAALTFFIETHTEVSVSGTPIQSPMSMDETWVNEALGNRGWTGANGFEKCFAYNRSIRDAFAAQWCYSIFIADSNPNVNQGLFAGGGYAFSYYGGPWVYMSRYSTWAFNYMRYYAVVPMHETGHIFMDTDEYDGQLQYGGYLNVADADFQQCIMNQNDSSRVCVATRNQLGWRDLDGNGIIEPLDVPPATSLTPVTPDPTTDATPTWNGRAQVATLPNLNPLSNYQPPHDMTIARIAAVECRVDGGAWSAAAASDGAFDAYGEDFAWTPAPLAPGTHVIEARAHTSAGAWTTVYASDTVTIAPSVGVEPAGARFALALSPPEPNPAAQGATLRFELPAPGFVSVEIASVDGRRMRMLLAGARPAGPGWLAWDGRDDLGRRVPAGIYLCRLRSAAGNATRRLAVVR